MLHSSPRHSLAALHCTEPRRERHTSIRGRIYNLVTTAHVRIALLLYFVRSRRLRGAGFWLWLSFESQTLLPAFGRSASFPSLPSLAPLEIKNPLRLAPTRPHLRLPQAVLEPRRIISNHSPRWTLHQTCPTRPPRIRLPLHCPSCPSRHPFRRPLAMCRQLPPRHQEVPHPSKCRILPINPPSSSILKAQGLPSVARSRRSPEPPSIWICAPATATTRTTKTWSTA